MKAGITLIGMLLFFNTAFATDYYVNSAAGDNSTGDGTSTKPWKTITYGLSQINGTGHTLHVEAGTYNTSLGEVFPIYMKNGVSLTGAGIDISIVDGTGSGKSVFYCLSIVDASTKFEGLTVKGGGGSQGGGLFISAGSVLRIINNKITSNSATSGSGIYILNSSPKILNNSFTSNGANAIYISNSSPVIKNNKILNNLDNSVYISGSTSAPLLINNIIAFNSSNGIYCTSSCIPSIINNTISDNTSNGIYISSASPDSIFNNIISYNLGYGILENGTTSDPVAVYYNMFFLNSQGLYCDEGTTYYFTINTLNSSVPECKNNIQGDPLYLDRLNRDYHESTGSPAVDSGDPVFAFGNEPLPNGSRINIGAYGNTSEATVTGSGSPSSSADYYVNALTGNDATGDGTSGTPWKTITYALTQITNSGCNVHIAAGTYDITLGEIFPLMMKDGVSLIGSGIDASIIDASSSGVNAVSCIGTTDVSTKIEDLTIKGGQSNYGGGISVKAGSVLMIADNKIIENHASIGGGGIYVSYSTVNISNNTITGNTISSHNGDGGGLYITNSTVTVSGNTISSNTVSNSAAFTTTGGIYLINSTADISNNIISNNHLGTWGEIGGIYMSGCSGSIKNNTITANETYNESVYVNASGIFITNSSPLVKENFIYNNIKAANCIYISGSGSSPTLEKNTITKNTGYAIYCTSSCTPTIINNTISGNTKDGIYLSSVTPDSIINNIISYNSGFGIFESGTSSDPGKVWYNLFHANTSGVYKNEGSTDYYVASDLNAGVAECKNNIDGDPLFVDQINNNYHIQLNSPAIDTGDPNSHLDPDGSRADIGAYYYTPPPDAPVATNGTSITQSGFQANWDITAGATGYYLDVATDAGFTVFFSGFNNRNVQNVTTYSITGLSANTQHYYRIRAYNATGTSASSNVISVATLQIPTPVAPTAVNASGITQTSFNANWNASATATGYYLDIATDNAFTSYVTGYNNKALANVITSSVSGLSPNTTYYYRVRAFNTGGYSASSNVISLTTLQIPALGAPTASAATNISRYSFNANWNASATATGYYLDVATNSSFTAFVAGFDNKNVLNVLTYNITGLSSGTTYYYRIRAYNNGGTSDNSNTIIVNTLSVTDHYVNAVTGSNTTGDGSSGSPWLTITYAFDHITGTGRHKINVAAGTYNLALGEAFPLIMADSVSLVGSGKETTIINANSTNYVIQCTGILDNLTRIEGFMISGGRSSGPGGIYISAGSALLITNNLITSNYADGNASGGAIHIINSSPRIEMNTITSNHGVDINKGATIYITGTTSAPVISNNTISDNANDLDGGGGTIGAGTIVVMSSSGTIIHNNIIINNNPGYYNEGGTVYMNSCSPSVRNNLIAKNIGNGICVFYSTSSPSIINNTISDNSYDGIYLYAGTPDSIFNNIISYNSSYGIREYSAGGDPAKVWYNLFYQNGSGLYYDEATTAITSVSTLNASVAECKNNLTGNPLFKDRTNNNYHLTTGSSAIDTGDPASPLDSDGSRADIGAYPMIPPPDPPVATIATGITYSGFQANWDASIGAAGYYLDIAKDEGFTVFINGFNNKNVENVTTFSVTGLNPNTGYYYRVRAYNADGTSASSNIINITTEQIPAPAAPTASNATNIGQTDFTANWTSSATATGYYLDVATDNAFTTFVTGFSNKDVLNLTSYNVTGLAINTSYYYRIRAYNTGGTSASSNVVTLTTLLNPPALPSAPVANSATKITQTSFLANWNTVSGATGYKLDVATDNSFTNYLTGYNNKAILNSTSDSVGGLTVNTIYYYRVRASNSGGSSANSGTITVTTLANPPLPPVCTSASAITQTSFTANWNSSTTASGYRLDISTNNGFTSFVSGYNDKDVGNLTNATVTGLSLNTAYYYRIRAYNSGGSSDNSNTVSVTTLLTAPTQPSAPTATSATGITQTGFTARWNTSSSSTGYYIDVSGNSTFSSFISGYSNKFVGNVTGTAITGLSAKSTYYYRVRAYNAYGTSGNSNAITVTTLPNPPAAPSGLTASSCNDQVTLSWSANTETDFLRYRIYGGTSSNPTTKIDSTTTGSISAVAKTLSGLTHGQTYYLRITAVVSPGVASTYSASVSVVVKKGVVPKIKSKFNDILICYNIGDSIASFQWYKGNTAISGATKQYYVTNKLPDGYSVLTTDKNGCKNSSNVINLTGSKSITVYPNPAKNSFMLVFSSEIPGRVMITLYNSSGTKVAEYQTFKTDNEMKYEVPASDFLDGIYTLQVVVEETEISFSRVIIIN
jgi:parallel beta-helix repeat protein